MSENQTITAADVGQVPAGTETPAQAEARKRAPAANFLPIVRGRLPLLFVHAVRFDKVLNPMSNKDLASKLGTSVGKVFDIKKGRNFAYVNEAFKPSAEDIKAAEDWLGQIGGANAKGLTSVGDKALVQNVINQYKERGMASAEEAASFSAARTAARPIRVASPAAPAASGSPAPAGEVQAAASGAADDLLS